MKQPEVRKDLRLLRLRWAILGSENRRILAASDVCHICGHPGSDAVDHVIPLARNGRDDVTNKKPAHHDVPCPTCGIKCNRLKGDKLIPPVIRRSASLA